MTSFAQQSPPVVRVWSGVVRTEDRDAYADYVERTGMSAAELNARLLDHELEGRVKRLPGQRFQRIAHG